MAAAASPAGELEGADDDGGDYANTRQLHQITPENIGKLKVAWMCSLGTTESQENTWLVIGDTMYVTTSQPALNTSSR